MKLLSICIPTYNRPDELRYLFQTFLSRVLDEYGSLVEVVVCDNSDDEKAQLNQMALGDMVCYYKNGTNLGGGANLARCAREATGEYGWFISDDDLYEWEGFKDMMDCLQRASKECIDCLIVPFSSRDQLGKSTVYYRKKDFGMAGDTEVSTFLNIVTRPFIFFSTAVIRLEKRKLDWVADKFKGNVFLQIPLYLSMLKPESKVRFMDTCVIEYKPGYDIGCDMIEVDKSMHDVILFLESEYGMDGAKLLYQAYKESLGNILNHRAGLYNFKNGDMRWHILTKLNKHLSIKTIIMTFMVILPKIVMKWPYIFYISYQNARTSEKLSITKIIANFNERRRFIQANKQEII